MVDCSGVDRGVVVVVDRVVVMLETGFVIGGMDDGSVLALGSVRIGRRLGGIKRSSTLVARARVSASQTTRDLIRAAHHSGCACVSMSAISCATDMLLRNSVERKSSSQAVSQGHISVGFNQGTTDDMELFRRNFFFNSLERGGIGCCGV